MSCIAAPSNKGCQYEKFEAIGCSVERLRYSLHELMKEVPLFRMCVGEYKCDLFEELDESGFDYEARRI